VNCTYFILESPAFGSDQYVDVVGEIARKSSTQPFYTLFQFILVTLCYPAIAINPCERNTKVVHDASDKKGENIRGINFLHNRSQSEWMNGTIHYMELKETR
jgi:hypothetical protein